MKDAHDLGPRSATAADERAVEPATARDPLLRHLATSIGGPAGSRLGPRRIGGETRFWSIPRVLTALTLIAILLSVLSMQHCRINGWSGVDVYLGGCYSDVTALYGSRGFFEDPWAPFTGTGEFEYPVLTGVLAAVMAQITHLLLGLTEAGLIPEPLAYWSERPSLLYWDVTFAATALVWIVLVLTVMRSAGRRPWDAALVAVSPAVILGAGINWDLWAAAALALAMLAHVRGRHTLTGVLIGIGISFKLYPLFLLGAILVLALRRHSGLGFPVFITTTLATAVSWLVINIPVMLIDFRAWSLFFTFSSERGAGYSSFWHIYSVVAEAGGGTGLGAGTISLLSFGLFALACVGVLILGLFAPQPPRLSQLMLLIVAAFLLVGKVYSPQFMIWLVPLIALAIPHWREALIWQGFQVLHFWAVWMYLAGIVGEAEPQHAFDPMLYVAAVLGHMIATLWLMGRVMQDILRPEQDIVRLTSPSQRL